MKKMIAYCGVVCSECDVYIATKNNNDQKKFEALARWKELYGRNVSLSEIYCDGCLKPNGQLFDFCKNCKIRSCAIEKQVENCAHCDQYLCGKLEKFLKHNLAAKIILDEIKAKL